MALYFTTNIPLEGKPLSEQVSCHKRLPLLAIGSTQNKVAILNSEDPLEKYATISHSTMPSSLSWHPEIKLLVIGWRDGSLTLWSEEGDIAIPAPHHDGLAVTQLEWTRRGTYLVTASKTRALVLWQLDRGKIVELWATKTPVNITNITHLSFPTIADTKPGAAVDEELLFVLCGNNNTVYQLDDSQEVTPFLNIDKDSTPSSVLWNQSKRHLLLLSNNNTIYQYQVDFDIRVQLVVKRKISSGPKADMNLLRMAWVSHGLVALTCGEDIIRVMNVDQDAMYALYFPRAVDGQPPQGGPSLPEMKRITNIVASDSKHLLAAGTRDGQIAMWSFSGGPDSTDSDDWHELTRTDGEGSVDTMRMSYSGTITLMNSENATVLQETQRKRKWCGRGSVVQVSPDTVVVSSITGTHFVIKSPTRIREVDIAYPQVALWSGRTVDIYAMSDNSGSHSLLQSVEHLSPVFALHSDGLLVCRGERITFQNFQNTPITALSFSQPEGNPTLIDVQGDFAAVVTKLNMLKALRISSRDLRPIGPARPLIQDGDTIVSSIKINAKGKKVAFLTKNKSSGRGNTTVHVWDLDTDKQSTHDFTDAQESPLSICWNTPSHNVATSSDLEMLMLAVETVSYRASNTNDASMAEDTVGDMDAGDTGRSSNRVYTLFSTTNLGVVVHHKIPLRTSDVCLLGFTVPALYMCSTEGGVAPSDHKLRPVKMRDFEGMNTDDAKLRSVLMEFSYYTTVGQMDDAYRAIKSVKDISVWQNLARLCVGMKRLDVAQVCLANMQDAMSARLLRQSADESVEARLAILASCLGMLDASEKILIKARRFDLLTELYMSAGKWNEAEKNAEDNDRIRIDPVRYRQGQYLESLGNIEEALQYYKRANCYGTEAPRLLFHYNRLNEIEALAQSSGDKDIVLWWAQHCESLGDLEGALRSYQSVGDTFNVIRIFSDQQNVDLAIDLLNKSENSSALGAAYFVARKYEDQRNVGQALHYYNIAGAFKNAIRLAKENEMHGEVLAMSLKSGDMNVALDSATYFESIGQYDKAAQLYRKGGDIQRAIDVCIQGGLYDVLHQISESLDSAADPETFIGMAKHFLNIEHYEKAAQMFVFGKAFNEALQLCMDHNVRLTEEMADAMTLPKTEHEDDEAYRISLFKKIAKVAKNQGLWNVACKKYTQAGERVKAMKMLLQTGETEKIIFFANHTRNNEIYVLAANYLQTQNWQTDTNIHKHIINFYSKAKAYESLALFYDSFAQMQIDEFRDYDKALITLREALKTMEKGDVGPAQKHQLKARIELVEKFVSARKMIRPGEACPEMVGLCTELLNKNYPDHPEKELLESAIRVGDVYALLVEYYEKLGQAENAYALIEKMQQQEIELTYFLEATLVQKICTTLGKDYRQLQARQPVQQQSYVHHAPPQNEDDGGNFEEEVLDD